MSRVSSWVPMPEVTERTEGAISVGYTGMPSGMDPASLELNVGALNRGVIGWGGFQDVTLAGYDGDKDRYDIGGGGVDESGTGYATGAVTVTKAETSNHDAASDKFLDLFSIRNGSLGIQWNINALNSRIETHEQFDPRVRAKQLDTEIRKTAIKGVWEHNVPDVIRSRPLDTLAVWGFVDALFVAQVAGDITAKDYNSLARSVGWRFGWMNVTRMVVPVVAKQRIQDVEWGDMITDPIFFSARPTRAAIGMGSLATSRLVRATSTGE